MQTPKLRPIFKLLSYSYNKELVRTVAVASANIKTPTETEHLKSWKEIPGPSSLPIIGTLHHFIFGGLSGLDELDSPQKLYDMYGPIVRLQGFFGMPTMILLGDPECCEQVLRGENWMPLRPGFPSLEYYRKSYKKKKGNIFNATGLITDHGDVWKEFRSTVNPVMLQPKTIKLYTNVIDEVAQDMVNRMRSIRDEKNMIQENLDVEMNLWALESIGTVALGIRLNCFDPDLAVDSPERELIQCIHDLFATAEKMDFKPGLWRYITTPMYEKAMKLYERQEELTRNFVRKGIKELNKNSDNEKGVLAKLLEINEEVAHIMASDMLFAGVDTAANTMLGILYLLATNPEKQEKLREEILSKSERTPYLKACVKESLRIMPVVSGNLRKTTKEYNLKGYKIPKDMNVVFLHRGMSLMDSQYPRAKEFIPERWLADKNDPLYYKNAHPFANAPFGFGSRSCIGRRIAELEIETFLSRLIENFQVGWQGSVPPKVVQTSIIYVKGPFNYVFKDV